MKYSYTRAFNALAMPPHRQAQIEAALSSHLAATQKEKLIMTKKKPGSYFLIAAVLMTLLLSLVGFTFGSRIITLLGGGCIEEGASKNGGSFVSMDTGFAEAPAEVREGRIYFVLDGSDRDITAECSGKGSFAYETLDAEGNRHVVLVGGTADALGWAEFVWDKTGEFKGSNATYPHKTEPAWLAAAQAELVG